MQRHRSPHSLLLAAALAAGSGGVTAQDFALGWNPRSGDPWVDAWLGDMNRYALRYRDPFIDELARYHGAPRDLVAELLDARRWAPADVYLACTIAQVIGQSCRQVADDWERDHAQGWGAVARRLGITPGSAEFHRLKNGLVPTYDRWARPIALDAELERVYPDRGNSTARPAATPAEHGRPDAPATRSPRPGGDEGKSPANGKAGH